MRFKVVGANSESGDDVDVFLDAPSREQVEQIAHDKGILVATIDAVDIDAISLIDDDFHPAPAKGGTAVVAAVDSHAPAHAPGHAAPGGVELIGDPLHAEPRHGLITLSANSPSETGKTTEGHAPHSQHQEQALEYHILMNQALYLLETAVNKYLRDGWEPQGGLTVGIANNAMQYFQALTRRKKTPPAP